VACEYLHTDAGHNKENPQRRSGHCSGVVAIERFWIVGTPSEHPHLKMIHARSSSEDPMSQWANGAEEPIMKGMQAPGWHSSPLMASGNEHTTARL
jgi:hypothetical protein